MLYYNLNDGGGDTTQPASYNPLTSYSDPSTTVSTKSDSASVAAAAAALRRLTSGATLTAAEKAILNIGNTGGTTGGTQPPVEPAGKPGAAWLWDGTKWVQPAKPADGKTYVWDNNNGWTVQAATVGGSGTGTGTGVADLNAAKDRILGTTLKAYGLEGIDTVIAQIRSDYPEISQGDLLTLLKDDPKYNGLYNQRFAGNVKRKAAGLQPLSDADYLKAEAEYSKVFKAYGTTSLDNRDYYATLIGNRMDPDDVSSRIELGYQVYKGNPNIKNAFNKFYGTVTDGDVVAAMLDPETQIPLLQKKITVAEIGGAALQQNLETSLASAQDLAAFGVTGATATAGYKTIAQKLPRGKFLTSISPELGIDYTQTMAENIQFKNDVKAAQQEQKIIGTEIARFGGTTGRLASRDRAQGLI